MTAFKNYDRKTRRFINKTVTQYLDELGSIPSYVNIKKFRKCLREIVIRCIFNLGDIEYLCFDTEAFCYLVTFGVNVDRRIRYDDFYIPQSIRDDVVNTQNFYTNIIEK